MLDGVAIRHVGHIALRAETVTDSSFFDDLAAACSPLGLLVPDDVIRQQAVFQRLGHEAAYPAAMRRIVTCANRPIGRLAIDWTPDHSRCVDIAIMPAARGTGIGTALLAAWLTVADRLELPAMLSVRRDNPAMSLYHRLGFTGSGDDGGLLLEMVRAR